MTDQELLEQNSAKRQECEVWTRVMGYHRPVSHFNKGKKSEFAERKWLLEEKICPCAMKVAV